MNEVAFEELLLDAQSSAAIVGLRKLILTAALRGEFDTPSEREFQLHKALQTIRSPVVMQEADRVRKPKRSVEVGTADSIAVVSAGDRFVVKLGDIAIIEKGKTGIKDAQPGEYPMVVTAEGRLSTDHFDFEGPAVIIPLVSSTGHGDASLKRIHYQDGKYAVGSILCAVQSRYPDLVHPRYLYEYLAAFKDELLVSRMSGTANVSLNVGRVAEVPVPLITFDAQKKLERLMSLCDALEAKGQLAATAHAQLVSTLLATLTDSETPAQLADNWHRIATHFDLLLDRPEAVDALEQTILQLAVRGQLTSCNKEEATSVQPDNALVIKGRPTFLLPEQWRWFRLGDLVELINGDRGQNYPNKAEYVSKGIPFINTGHIDPDGSLSSVRMNFLTREKFNSLRGGKVRKGDLVYCLRGATLGKTAIVDYEEGAIASSLVIVRPSAELNSEYAYLYLTSSDGRSFIQQHDNGSAQPNLAAASLKKYWIPLPSLAEQSRIVTRVAQLRRLCADLRQRLSAFQSTQAHLAEALVQEVV